MLVFIVITLRYNIITKDKKKGGLEDLSPGS